MLPPAVARSLGPYRAFASTVWSLKQDRQPGWAGPIQTTGGPSKWQLGKGLDLVSTLNYINVFFSKIILVLLDTKGHEVHPQKYFDRKESIHYYYLYVMHQVLLVVSFPN